MNTFQLSNDPVVPSRWKSLASSRERARAIIGRIIAAQIGQPRKVIKKAIREAYTQFADKRSGYAYKAWCSEVAFALRERSRRPGPARPIPAEEIIPSARAWAADRGLLEVTAILDIDQMDDSAVDTQPDFSLNP